MNILVLSWRDPKHPLSGGAEQVMHEHMKRWISEGHDVTFFSSRFEGSRKREKIDGVKIIRRGYHLYLGVQTAAFFWYLFDKHPKYDLVIDEFHGLPFFTPLFVRTKKLAVLQEVAREVWLKNDLKWPLNWIIGMIGYLIEPAVFLFYKSTPFMVGSESAKGDLASVGINPKKVTVINHGVLITPPKKLPGKEKKKTVIFLGALAKDKGIEDAIRTFGILNKRNKYQFWVVGKGGADYIQKLKKLCESLGLSNNVIFWGFVSDEKKFELLARAHVMINPSLLEGWGLVNIEANAMRTPVVAYRSRGLIDSVKDGKSGILVKKNMPQKLSQAVEGLFKNKKLFKTLQNGALEWSNKFSWEESGKNSLSLIKRITNG